MTIPDPRAVRADYSDAGTTWVRRRCLAHLTVFLVLETLLVMLGNQHVFYYSVLLLYPVMALNPTALRERFDQLHPYDEFVRRHSEVP